MVEVNESKAVNFEKGLLRLGIHLAEPFRLRTHGPQPLQVPSYFFFIEVEVNDQHVSYIDAGDRNEESVWWLLSHGLEFFVVVFDKVNEALQAKNTRTPKVSPRVPPLEAHLLPLLCNQLFWDSTPLRVHPEDHLVQLQQGTFMSGILLIIGSNHFAPETVIHLDLFLLEVPILWEAALAPFF